MPPAASLTASRFIDVSSQAETKLRHVGHTYGQTASSVRKQPRNDAQWERLVKERKAGDATTTSKLRVSEGQVLAACTDHELEAPLLLKRRPFPWQPEKGNVVVPGQAPSGVLQPEAMVGRV